MQPIYRSSDRTCSRSRRPVVVAGSLLGAAGAVLAVALLSLIAPRTAVLAAAAQSTNQPSEELVREASIILAPTGSPLPSPADDEPSPQYRVSVQVVGYGAVNLTPLGPYSSGAVVSAVADPSPGHRFDGWSGAFSGSENPLTLTVESDLLLIATFVPDTEPRTYTVTSNALSGGWVEVTPPGPFAPGEIVTVTAHPNPDWRFARWSGEINGSRNPFSFAVIDDTEVVAIFEMKSRPLTLTLTTGSDGEGVVTMEPPGPFAPGQTVTITATAAEGWEFTGWEGHLQGRDNPYVLTIITHTTAIARFQRSEVENKAALNIEIHGSGEVLPEPAGPYSLGQLVKLRAVAQPGWRFDHWGGAQAGDDNPLSFPVLGDTLVVAHFAPVAPTPVSLTVHITGSGQVQRDPPEPYVAGQLVKLIAVPAPGWHFTGWSGDLAGAANLYTFTLVKDVTVYATFAPYPPPDDPPIPTPPDDPVEEPAPTPPPTPAPDDPLNPPPDEVAPEPDATPAVDVHVAGAGKVERDPPGPYEPGQLITLTAQAETGWVFAGWSGSLTGQQNPYAATVTATLAVTATFIEAIPYQVITETRGAGAVDLAPPGPYQPGQRVTLTASPAPGQCFQGWSGSVESAANPHTVQITKDLAVTAQFGPCPLHLPMVQGRN